MSRSPPTLPSGLHCDVGGVAAVLLTESERESAHAIIAFSSSGAIHDVTSVYAADTWNETLARRKLSCDAVRRAIDWAQLRRPL